MNAFIRAKNQAANRVFLKVEHVALNAVGEFNKVAGHGARQSMHFGNAVANLHDHASFNSLEFGRKIFDFASENRYDFV
ncbi:MAG: hypothetical protein ACD_39C00871G0003 [uncultured bacterium]|nr:MAG: hypothetical protein ACD_39C00871G0003 [uncultured bacterium]